MCETTASFSKFGNSGDHDFRVIKNRTEQNAQVKEALPLYSLGANHKGGNSIYAGKVTETEENIQGRAVHTRVGGGIRRQLWSGNAAS
jgi:hypothetical protein